MRTYPVRPRGFFARIAQLFKREEATTFHRCLAVHLYFQAPRSALD